MLLDIVDEVFAPVTTPDYVAMMVEDFLVSIKTTVTQNALHGSYAIMDERYIHKVCMP